MSLNSHSHRDFSLVLSHASGQCAGSTPAIPHKQLALLSSLVMNNLSFLERNQSISN